jgi:Family of unknown function (DUF5706)
MPTKLIEVLNNMNIERRVSILENTLTRQLAWIAAADAKTGFIFAVSTAMIGFLASAAPAYGKWTSVGVVLAIAAAVLLLGSLGCVVLAVFPRTSGPKSSVIFFGGIAGRSVNSYRVDVQALIEEEYEEDLIRQCHINAQIASNKYHWIKFASVLLAVGTLPWLAAAYILFRDK